MSNAFACGIAAIVVAMNPVVSKWVRFTSQLEAAPVGIRVEELICASEQSFFVGLAARGPNTLRNRSGLPSGDLGEPSVLTTATVGVAPATVTCLALPLLK